MKKTENIIVIIALIALGLKLIFIPGSGILTVVTFSSLSLIYFYFGFALFNHIKLRKIFKKDSYKEISSQRMLGTIGSGLALSTTTMGILFKFQSWPGAFIYLATGLIGLILVTLFGYLKYSKSKADFYIPIFKRAAVFGGIALVLLLIPQATWIEIKYRDSPAFVEAYKKALADPENKALWDIVEAERQKMKD